MENRLKKRLSVVVCLSLFTVVLVTSVWHTSVAMETQEWSQAQGVMLDASMLRSGKHLTPFFRYRYTVDGMEYLGHRLFPREFVDDKTAMEWLSAFKLDQPVSVFYNPKNPTDSFLVKDDSIFERQK